MQARGPESTASSENVYFIHPNGSDANTGAATAPWRTLQYAADRVEAGDTVVIHAGNYQGFELRSAGRPGHAITFRADPGVTITSAGPRTPDGINLQGSAHVTVEGFTIVGMPRAGIRVEFTPSVTIRRNTLTQNTVWGILTGFSDDVLIEGNVATGTREQHGIYVSNSGDRPIVRGNRVGRNRCCGIHVNGDIRMGGDGVITHALIENNVIFDNGRGGGSGINGDGVCDAVIRNNLLYDGHASGISLFRDCGGSPSVNNHIHNNTVVMANDGLWALNIQNGSTGTAVRNNILLCAHPARGGIAVGADCRTGLVSDHNILSNRLSLDGGGTRISLGKWQELTGQDRRTIVAHTEDIFVAPDDHDFRLRPESPAIDQGAPGAVLTDLDGMPRPAGQGFDIGAYESPHSATHAAGSSGPWWWIALTALASAVGVLAYRTTRRPWSPHDSNPGA